MQKFAVVYSTLFKIGYIKRAPGTWGTLAGALIYFFAIPPDFLGSFRGLVLLIIFSVFSQYFISISEKQLGKDDKRIVMDEFIGYLFGVWFLPKSFTTLVISFILFRFFDIVKPEPVNALQKIPWGIGVLADDIAAGVYTNIVLQAMLLLSIIK